VDGGRTADLEGKLALLAGCTAPSTPSRRDRNDGRALRVYRLPQLNAVQEQEQARRGLPRQGKKLSCGLKLADAVAALFNRKGLAADARSRIESDASDQNSRPQPCASVGRSCGAVRQRCTASASSAA